MANSHYRSLTLYHTSPLRIKFKLEDNNKFEIAELIQLQYIMQTNKNSPVILMLLISIDWLIDS